MKRTFTPDSLMGKRVGVPLLGLLWGLCLCFAQSVDGGFEDFNLIDPDLQDSITVSVGNLSVAKEDTARMKIAFYNNNPISSFSFRVALPQGVVALNKGLAVSQRLASWNISIVENGGSLLIAGTPKGNYLLQRGFGEVLSFPITASELAIETNHNIEISTHSFLSYNTTALDPLILPSTLTVTPLPLAGDFNNNGLVDQADVDRAVHLILTDETEGINPKITDLNRDGRLSVTDIAGMINHINF